MIQSPSKDSALGPRTEKYKMLFETLQVALPPEGLPTPRAIFSSTVLLPRSSLCDSSPKPYQKGKERFLLALWLSHR